MPAAIHTVARRRLPPPRLAAPPAVSPAPTSSPPGGRAGSADPPVSSLTPPASGGARRPQVRAHQASSTTRARAVSTMPTTEVAVERTVSYAVGDDQVPCGRGEGDVRGRSPEVRACTLMRSGLVGWSMTMCTVWPSGNSNRSPLTARVPTTV